MHITGIKRKPPTGHPVGGLRRFLYDKMLLNIIASQVGSRKDKTATFGIDVWPDAFLGPGCGHIGITARNIVENGLLFLEKKCFNAILT